MNSTLLCSVFFNVVELGQGFLHQLCVLYELCPVRWSVPHFLPPHTILMMDDGALGPEQDYICLGWLVEKMIFILSVTAALHSWSWIVVLLCNIWFCFGSDTGFLALTSKICFHVFQVHSTNHSLIITLDFPLSTPPAPVTPLLLMLSTPETKHCET